jgi:ribose 5-phosphate isomerase
MAESYDMMQLVTKILLNSLYGKWGQKEEREMNGIITDNTNFIYEMAVNGNLGSIQ